MECLSGFLRSSIAELTITGRNGILMQKRSATAVGDSGFTLMQNTQENEKLWEHDASKLCEHDASKLCEKLYSLCLPKSRLIHQLEQVTLHLCLMHCIVRCKRSHSLGRDRI